MHYLEKRKCRRQNGGFTLIELIVSLALLGILTAVLGMGVVGALNVYSVSEENVRIAQQNQLAMARIDRELRELTEVISHSDPSYIVYRNLRGSTGIHAIEFDSNNSRLQLYSDLASGTTSLNSPSVTPDILLQGVSAFSLSYLQGTQVWTGGNDRFLSHIRVDLTMNRSGSIATNSEPFTSLVYLRNTINYGGAAPAVEPPEPPSMSSYSCFIGACGNDHSFTTDGSMSASWFLVMPGIFLVIFAAIGASETASRQHLKGPTRHTGTTGSALIAVIVAIVLFSTIAAALLPLVGSSGHQSVARDQADKAYLMAESGFRYAASAYVNETSDADKLQKLDDLHKSLYHTGQGDFSLNLFSYFFRVSTAVSAGTTNQLVVSTPGDMPPDIAAAIQDDTTYFDGLKLRIGNVAYTILSFAFTSPDTDAGIFTLQDSISEDIAVNEAVYPVADVTVSQTLNSGDPLTYESNDARMFPDHNGLIQVAGRNLSYRLNDKIASQFVDVRDLNDSSPIQIHSGDEILLRRHVRLESTGTYGSGGFEVSRTVTYDTPLYFGGIADAVKTFEDPNMAGFAQAPDTVGVFAPEVVNNNTRLQVQSVSSSSPLSRRASLIALSASDAKETLRKSYQNSGNFLSYDAQVKVGFLNDPSTMISSDNDYYFAGGISFRLDKDKNGYGISIMRGKDRPEAYDYIDDNLVPPGVEDRMLLVLWRQVDGGNDSNWLAYKDIDEDITNGIAAWPVQDTTLVVRIKEAVVLSFENGTTIPIEKGNVILGQDSGARGRVIQGPILDNGTTWANGTSGYLLLNAVSGNFQNDEDLLVVGRGVLATVRSYSNQRTNIIRIYYGTPDTSVCGTGDTNPFNNQLNCYPLGTSPLLWPPDLKNDGELSWPADEDYFRLIQWDGVNTAGESNLSLMDSDAEPDAIILHHNNALQTPTSSYPDTRPELGLHAYGRGATNIYFDDFGLQLTIRVSAVIPTPVQQ
jgi:prepilin-type N-terminal cleavage/methylation domain-containing protein